MRYQHNVLLSGYLSGKSSRGIGFVCYMLYDMPLVIFLNRKGPGFNILPSRSVVATTESVR